MFYSNTLNLIQVGGGTQVKQGDLGSKFSYKLANEKDQELDDFDKEVAHINLVLDDKIVFTTTATVDSSTVTFNIDKAIPVGLYFLEIKIRDYIFPSDKQTIIFVQSGAVAYDLKELVPNYDVNMTLKGILSDLSQKGIDISDLNRRMAEKVNKDEVTNVMTPKGTLAYASLPTSGNQVGWYYYCPDGDGVHGAGNYVWNGTSWYFGGTGDEGYNLLKGDIVNLDENLFTNFESSSILDFDLGEIDSFIPYRRSRNAGVVYVTNGNLISPKVTWINNNGSQFDGVNGSSDTNRVRTSTFSIPSECEYLTLSGYDKNIIKLMAVRAFDNDKKLIKRGCIIAPKDDYYIIKVAVNVSEIHLLFGTISGDAISPTTVSSMPLMLNIGIEPRPYVEPKRKEIGMSIYNYGNEVNVLPSWGLYNHNTIWTYGSAIQFLYKNKNKKNNNDDNVFSRYKKSKFYKKCVIPQYYDFYEYQKLSNITEKFNAGTTAEEYINAVHALYLANTDYITRRHFGERDASGTYTLYAYEMNNSNFSFSNKPKILLICNQHGYEKNSAFSAYWFMDALCNHYQESKLLTFLRNEVSFLIAPLVNPWGFNEYVGDKVGTGTGYENANGVNINRDYENLTSPESQFVMHATDRFSNATLSIDLHSNGTTRTSNDYEQLNWHSYENNSALFLVDVSDEFLNLASQAISKELNIDDTSMGLINIGEKSSNGHTLTYAWSNLSMTNLCFEVPMRLPTESEEDTVLCQKIGTELLVNFIGMTLQKYKEFN